MQSGKFEETQRAMGIQRGMGKHTSKILRVYFQTTAVKLILQ